MSRLTMASCWLMASLAGSTLQAADEVALFDYSTATDPVAHEKPPIDYPPRTRAEGIEGWVTLEFTIDEEGNTRDVNIVDRSYEKLFDEAAIAAVEASTYEPATIDGEPVSTIASIRIVFAFQNQRDAVSGFFARRYQGIARALSKGELDKAWEKIEKIEDRRQRTLAEVCYLDFLKAEYYERSGDEERAREHVERALVIADTAVAPPTYEHLLRSAMRLDVEAGFVADALGHYDELVELAGKLADDDPSRALAQ